MLKQGLASKPDLATIWNIADLDEGLQNCKTISRFIFNTRNNSTNDKTPKLFSCHYLCNHAKINYTVRTFLGNARENTFLFFTDILHTGDQIC